MNFSENIYILENNTNKPLIVYFREPKKTNLNTVNQNFDYLTKITKKEPFHIIIDLSNTTPPSAEVRNEIKHRFKSLKDQVISYNVYLGKNTLLKIAVKFVGVSLGLQNLNVVSSTEEAISSIINGT